MACRARGDLYLYRQRICGVHRLNVMARRTAQIDVCKMLMAKRARRMPNSPCIGHYLVVGRHRCQLCIKVRWRLRLEFVTRSARLGRGQDAGIGGMTRKAGCMPDRRRLESTLFQPERIADVCWRFGQKLVVRFTLRCHSLMTYCTTLFTCVTGSPANKRRINERRLRPNAGHDLNVLIVRKTDNKIRLCGFPLWRLVEDLARVRIRVSRTVIRRRVRVTDRTNLRWRAFEKLLFVTAHAGLMFWVIGNVGKRSISSAHLVPIVGRKLMAFAAVHLVRLFAVLKLCVLRRFHSGRRSGACGCSGRAMSGREVQNIKCKKGNE